MKYHQNMDNVVTFEAEHSDKTMNIRDVIKLVHHDTITLSENVITVAICRNEEDVGLDHVDGQIENVSGLSLITGGRWVPILVGGGHENIGPHDRGS